MTDVVWAGVAVGAGLWFGLWALGNGIRRGLAAFGLGVCRAIEFQQRSSRLRDDETKP